MELELSNTISFITLMFIPLCMTTAVYFLLYLPFPKLLWAKKFKAGKVFLLAAITALLMLVFSVLSGIFFDSILPGKALAILIILLIIAQKERSIKKWHSIIISSVIFLGDYINRLILLNYMMPFD